MAHSAPTSSAIARWEALYLTDCGHYKGVGVHRFGFPYKFGEYVPIDKRYSAMMAHRWAMICHTGN